MDPSATESLRRQMVERQLIRRGIRDQRVLAAMGRVPRERFVTDTDLRAVYGDHALQIDCGQTISQPYMVALMSEALSLRGGERVLEIGTGSGYQAAVLALLAGEVFSIERHAPLARAAAARLAALELSNVHVYCGDGTLGRPEAAPFDRIVVTAGGRTCPAALLEQLAEGGLLVGPFGGEASQVLQRIERRGGEFSVTNLTSCRFVPLVADPGGPRPDRE